VPQNLTTPVRHAPPGVARLTHAAAIDVCRGRTPRCVPRVLTIAPARWNVKQVETQNQSGMGSAVRRCPRRALARAEQTGDNRMSGITMNTPPAPSVLPNGGFLAQPWEGRTARLASRRLRSSVVVIRAHGGIDASNADTLTEYTSGHLVRCRGLILDLRDLDFFGTEGFSALHRVSVCCARAGTGWAVVSGAAVSRVLRIGDPQGLLPAGSTLEAAMAIVQDRPHGPPQPIASRRDPGRSSRCERTVCLICGGTHRSAMNSGP
jgi:anti-anti-sigma factor